MSDAKLMNAAELDDDSLAWIWAYKEQLNLLDHIDAELITTGLSRWNDDQAYRFLSVYGLLRWDGLKNLASRRRFISICMRHFAESLPLELYAKEIQCRWNAAEESLRKDGFGTLRSASSKVFALAHPDKVTMYDRYAPERLAIWAKEKDRIRYKSDLKPENYYLIFDGFFKSDAEDRIESVSKYFSRSYPYHLRVADKYLWLRRRRSERFQRTVDAFRKSLELAPFDKDQTV